jgi:hypothetical protein
MDVYGRIESLINPSGKKMVISSRIILPGFCATTELQISGFTWQPA